MSNHRYIEIDSTYRNRNIWPLPADFQVLISQSGKKNKMNADDPVSMAANLTSWIINDFNTTGPTATVEGAVLAVDSPGLGASGNNTTVLELLASIGHTYQQIEDYYFGAVAVDITGTLGSSRIIGYKYLGTTGGRDRVQLTLSGITSVSAGDLIEINDPTDFSNTSAPFIFIPNGRLGSNAYPGYLLYNETLSITNGIPEYRTIENYDAVTHLLDIVTTGATSNSSGPIVGWAVTDTMSIRREVPQVGVLNNSVASTTVFFLTFDVFV